MFTEGTAKELEGTGVSATAHCPGATGTNFASVAGNDNTPLFKLAVAIVDAWQNCRDSWVAQPNRGIQYSVHPASFGVQSGKL